MPTFRYSAYKAGGSPVTGTIDADTIREARALLKNNGLYPRELTSAEEAPGNRTLKLFSRSRVGLTELSLMTRRLSTLVGSAVPIFEAITTLYDQEEQGELKKVLGRVRDRLAEGATLAKALAAEPYVFGESYTSMVAAGEASGALEIILDRLADFQENQEEVRSRVITSLAYPVLMVVVGTAVMMFLLAFVVPKIVVIFEENKAALPLITVLLIKTSTLVRQGWWALLLAVAIAVTAYKKAIKRESVRFKRDTFLLSIPLVGPLFRRLILARFAKVLGLLLESGVPIIRALEITGEVVVNRKYREFFMVAREELAEGGSLSASLRTSSLFPPLLVHMVSVGERGGRLEAMLVKAGTAYEKEFSASVSRFMALLEPLLVLAMGLGVGIVVLAVLLPIFQLNQMIK
jgi:general secretion pathway protein F